MKLSDYIAEFLALHTPRVYAVCGAGAMHLNDSIANHPGIETIAMHHEQAATYAAEADARVTGRIGVVHVTAGPGGTNTVTGLACAYVDSIPLMVIAGQVTTQSMIGRSGTRQIGMNELDLPGIVGSITKYVVTVTTPFMVRYYLEKAYHMATTGRPGPVWIEVPLDVQAAEVNPDTMTGFDPNEGLVVESTEYLEQRAAECVEMLRAAQRPVLIVGNGVRLSGACRELRRMVDRLCLPVVSSWGAADIVATDHPCYIGRGGLFGDRASNFAVQNADLILAIGTRLSAGQIGHHPKLFARNARKIVVDIDSEEINKPTVGASLAVVADAGMFLRAFEEVSYRLGKRALDNSWLSWCRSRKDRYPVVPADCAHRAGGVDAYYFVDQIGKHLADDAVVVTDVGFSFIPVMQGLNLRAGQRLFHSAGVSPMGWAIPACIGAAKAGPGRQIVCLTGDGGAMLNLQELQTIAHHHLPVSIFVFANDGYATMRITQNTHFRREVLSGRNSGLSVPDFEAVARAFGIVAIEVNSNTEMAGMLPSILEGGRGPQVVVLHMAKDQVIAPRVQPRMDGTKFLPTALEDMWPHLDRDEFRASMIVDEAVT